MNKSENPANSKKNTTEKAKPSKANNKATNSRLTDDKIKWKHHQLDEETSTTTANGKGVVKKALVLAVQPWEYMVDYHTRLNVCWFSAFSRVLRPMSSRRSSKFGNFHHVKGISWICEPTLPQVQRIVRTISNKANASMKTLDETTINAEEDNVLCSWEGRKWCRRSVYRVLWKRTNFVTDMFGRPSESRLQIKYVRFQPWKQEATVKAG